MKKLLLSGVIIFGCVSFASAQAADIDPNVAAKAPQKTTAKATNPQKAAIQAQDMSARGAKTRPGTISAKSTKGAAAKRKQEVKAVPSDAAASKKD